MAKVHHILYSVIPLQAKVDPFIARFCIVNVPVGVGFCCSVKPAVIYIRATRADINAAHGLASIIKRIITPAHCGFIGIIGIMAGIGDIQVINRNIHIHVSVNTDKIVPDRNNASGRGQAVPPGIHQIPDIRAATGRLALVEIRARYIILPSLTTVYIGGVTLRRKTAWRAFSRRPGPADGRPLPYAGCLVYIVFVGSDSVIFQMAAGYRYLGGTVRVKHRSSIRAIHYSHTVCRHIKVDVLHRLILIDDIGDALPLCPAVILDAGREGLVFTT